MQSTRSRLWLAAGSATVLMVAVVGTSLAAIPNATDGKIYSCHSQSNGTWRPIDFPAQKCKGGESLLSWNQVGPAGPQGDPGLRGPEGQSGPAGESGFNTLLQTSSEAAGSACLTGGLRLDAGLDDGAGAGHARDGILQPGEVDATSYVCNGANGLDGIDGSDGADGRDGVDGTGGPVRMAWHATLSSGSGGGSADSRDSFAQGAVVVSVSAVLAGNFDACPGGFTVRLLSATTGGDEVLAMWVRSGGPVAPPEPDFGLGTTIVSNGSGLFVRASCRNQAGFTTAFPAGITVDAVVEVAAPVPTLVFE